MCVRFEQGRHLAPPVRHFDRSSWPPGCGRVKPWLCSNLPKTLPYKKGNTANKWDYYDHCALAERKPAERSPHTPPGRYGHPMGKTHQRQTCTPLVNVCVRTTGADLSRHETPSRSSSPWCLRLFFLVRSVARQASNDLKRKTYKSPQNPPGSFGRKKEHTDRYTVQDLRFGSVHTILATAKKLTQNVLYTYTVDGWTRFSPQKPST